MRRSDCVLIDGNGQAHRAWHATGASPYPASVCFNALIKNAVLAHRPRYAAVAFDSPDLWRKARMPAYKSTRAAKEVAMTEWLEGLRGLDNVGGVPVVTAPRNEADDVIATLHGEARVANLSVVVVAADRDLWALIDDATVACLMATTGSTVYVDDTAVHAKMGIVPWHVAAYKSLVGDLTDNVPGVPGIGPKRAAQLLWPHREYGSSTALGLALAALTSPPVRGSIVDAQSAGLQAYDVIHLNNRAPVSRRLRFCQVAP